MSLTIDIIVPPSTAPSQADVIAVPSGVQSIDIDALGTGGVGEAPQNGEIYGRSNATWQPIDYTTLPTEIQMVPVSFLLPGQPDTGMQANVPMVMPLLVPQGLAGTVAYAGTEPMADATFTLNRISQGVTTWLGFISLGPNSSQSVSGNGGQLATGDVLQLVAPSTPDAILADVGITVLTQRVEAAAQMSRR